MTRVAIKTVEAAKSLFDAPSEIESLLNDLADAGVLLQSVKQSVEDVQE